MSHQPTVTILFADVCRSTQIYEQHGDVAGRAIVGNCLRHLGEVVQSHSGRVVKTIGDEIMCVLPSPEQGLRAAAAMQRRVMSELELMAHSLTVRIGLHHGPVIREGGDVFGDTVNVAARMAGLAKAQQIICTRAMANLAPIVENCELRDIGSIAIKGKQLPIEIIDVFWQENASLVTMVSASGNLFDSQPLWSKVSLRLGEQHIELDDSSPPVMLGRDQGNGLVLNDEWVSRIHASVEYVRGHFAVIDRSTNGTYIQPDGDMEVRLHRDEFRLRQRGTISLGRMAALRSPEEIVSFECVANSRPTTRPGRPRAGPPPQENNG